MPYNREKFLYVRRHVAVHFIKDVPEHSLHHFIVCVEEVILGLPGGYMRVLHTRQSTSLQWMMCIYLPSDQQLVGAVVCKVNLSPYGYSDWQWDEQMDTAHRGLGEMHHLHQLHQRCAPVAIWIIFRPRGNGTYEIDFSKVNELSLTFSRSCISSSTMREIQISSSAIACVKERMRECNGRYMHSLKSALVWLRHTRA